MAPSPHVSCLKRDFGPIISIARTCGCWPLRNAKGREDNDPTVAWREDKAVTSGHWQEMSWASFFPYYTILVMICFLLNLIFHVHNTAMRMNDQSLNASEMLVSMPWIAYLSMPFLTSLLLLVRAYKVADLLCRWKVLEERLNQVLTCRPHQRYPIMVLTAYLSAAVVTLGILIYQLLQNPHASYYWGNLLPGEWAWVGYVGQHLMVIPAWSGIFVSEALVVIVAHHFSSYYAVLNHRLHTLFYSFTPKTNGGRMANSLQRPKSVSLTPNHRPLQVDSVYHFSDEDFQEQFQQVLCTRESVGDLLNTFNAIFSPIVLANLSMLTIVTVALFPQVLKNESIRHTIGYLVVAVSGVIRLIVVVVGQACVHDQASTTRGVVSKMQMRVAMAGEGHVLLPAALEHLAATQDAGISAWGCFTVTRGTLLTIASFIASYIVIILQF